MQICTLFLPWMVTLVTFRKECNRGLLQAFISADAKSHNLGYKQIAPVNFRSYFKKAQFNSTTR